MREVVLSAGDWTGAVRCIQYSISTESCCEECLFGVWLTQTEVFSNVFHREI